ncbi:hypothetical protein UB46_18805 [Burkholderiaceae bacterium 16]|nr:hypothetical protein UB46_18805 [Burkholderiaceae bacterium 16]
MIERKTTQPGPSMGNGVVLVLADSRRTESCLLQRTVVSALGHFRIPYRIHDIACESLSSDILGNVAAILIGQENLGLGLTSADISLILNEVQEGAGLISLDPYFYRYDGAWAEALGLASGNSPAAETYGITSIRVHDNSHYISYTQKFGDVHTTRMPTPAVRPLKYSRDWQIIATSEESPAFMARVFGAGRVIQWLISPRLWTLQFFGHAHGLDDMYWKGIVWAARKPFAMLPMPPFVRFRFDDCTGLYRTAEDLSFLKVLNKFGHKPNLCVSMNALQDDGWKFLKALYDAGGVEVAPHTWSGGVGLYYGDSEGEYSDQKLRSLIMRTKKMMDDHGITPSKILSDHDHECSELAMPLLRELGIEFKMNVMMPGETWTGIHLDWEPGPYGSMCYALDYIPGPDPLFVVFNHYPTFDYARVGIGGSKFLLSRDGGVGPYKWDFLNGLTKMTLGENDIEAMASRLADHTRLGLNSLFFGGSISHSHFSSELSLREWEAVLERYEKLTDRLTKINVGYDDICVYARSRHHTFIERAEIRREVGNSSIVFGGMAEVPLKLYVASNAGDGVDWSLVDVPAFSDHTAVRF